jgi:hypothetical protein
MPNSYCAVGWCPGCCDDKGSSKIPLDDVQRVFSNAPFNYSRAEIQRIIDEDTHGNRRNVCRLHVSCLAPFTMHGLQTDPQTVLFLEGFIKPQPGYLLRMGLTLEVFLQRLKEKYTAPPPPLADDEVTKKEIKSLQNQLKGYKGQRVNLEKKVANLTEQLDDVNALVERYHSYAYGASIWSRVASDISSLTHPVFFLFLSH